MVPWERHGKQATLFAALARAQAKMETPKFDSTNPHFKSKFASLVATIKATKPALNEEGLALTQFPVRGSDGMPMLRTILTHADGGMLSEDMPLLPGKNDMQGLGAAITYARRFSWSAVCGIASEEDDDGNSTVPAATGASRSASQPKTDPVATPAPPKAENGSQRVQLVSDPQKRKIGVLLRERQVDEGVYRAKLATFNVEHTKDLTVPQASALIEWLTELSTVAT